MTNTPLKTSSFVPQPVSADLNSTEDQIDLQHVYSALIRHKRLIACVAGGCLFLSTLFAFTRKPIWQGSFQIVLENQSAGGSGLLSQLGSTQNPVLAGLVGLNFDRNGNQLLTEVEILESPSVLKPIFDFVKANKTRAGQDVSNWRYPSWLNDSLDIELEKGTSVLNITYRDTDQQLILPVLDRISKEYQDYSGRDRLKGITKSVDYLEDQLKKMRIQADKSLRVAKTFALSNRLVSPEIYTTMGQLDIAQTSPNTTGTSAPGFVANSQNHPIDQGNKSLYNRLQDLDVKIEQKKSLLNSNDPSIQFLERQRIALNSVIEKNLNVKASDAMLQYSELVRSANQDQVTLATLEVQLQAARLEKARQSEPWQLISTPTVLDFPVAPLKKRIAALGLLAGLVLGSGAALLVDRRTGLLWSIEELQGLLPYTLLTQLSMENEDLWQASLTLLSQSVLHDKSSIALLVVDPKSLNTAMGIAQVLNQHANRDVVSVAENPLAAAESDSQIILAELGNVRRDQAQNIQQQLQLQGKPVLGMIVMINKKDMSIG